MAMFSWPEAKAEFDLDPEVVHLNHGSYGAVPRVVREHQDRLRRHLAENPNRTIRWELLDLYEKARAEAARFLGADMEGLVFVPNATSGVTAALRSRRLGRGHRVLISDHVYGGVWFAAASECQRVGAEIDVFSLGAPGEATRALDALEQKVEAFGPHVVILEHITSPTATLLPITELTAAARRAGAITIVDAAHVPGLHRPEFDSDFWVGNFHKWAFAPLGAAALWVDEAWREATEPLVSTYGSEVGFPDSFRWQGTDDYTAYLSIPRAIAFLEELGAAEVCGYNLGLARAGRDVVSSQAALPAPLSEDEMSAMALFELPDGLASDLDGADAFMRAMSDKGFEVAANPFGGRGYLRLSAQIYNTLDDFALLAAAL